MLGIDQEIAFLAGHNARHDQKEAAFALLPGVPVGLADGAILLIPPGKIGGIQLLIGDAIGNRDADEVLVGRHDAATVHQFFEHRCRVMLTRIEHRTRGRIPSARIDRRSSRVKDRVMAVRIANPIAGQNAIEDLSTHTAVPCSRRPITSLTS